MASYSVGEIYENKNRRYIDTAFKINPLLHIRLVIFSSSTHI